ncbi:response regulator [Caldimonas brevitalea]|uniref:Response regulator n=1 Tax=Caldimonas brevitalea TaxID=413882 RepID=A0A0G3BSZ6_9BURK|nr:response regulator [Caldimonas brevitalea]AKJ29655.1 response regulator [Caldimonas brevitalea]
MNKPSLLFVDDEPSILVALRVVFRTGYDVVTTTDAHQAVELLKQKRFDVIVSDQRMPEMTGVQLLRHACELSPDTTRILLTGYSDADAIVGAINEGEVYRYAQKPWDNATLKALVDEAVVVARRVREPESGVGELAEALAPPEQEVAAPVAGDREVVLVVDPKSALYPRARHEIAADFELVAAARLDEVFKFMDRSPVGIMICAFDVQNEADCRFLQALKQQYPHLLVIAVCDSMDSARLIELINRAKIFRFVKNPVPWALLGRYLGSAVSHLRELKQNPALLYRQAADPLPGVAALVAPAAGAPAAPAAVPLAGGARSLSGYFAKMFGFSKRR